MSGKKYWLTDVSGIYAQVEGAEQRDYWRQVQGWGETSEPAPDAQVYVQHPEAGRGRLPYASVIGGWDALGWSFAAPPDPVDLTKDPQLVDVPAAATAPADTAKSPAPTSGTVSREK